MLTAPRVLLLLQQPGRAELNPITLWLEILGTAEAFTPHTKDEFSVIVHCYDSAFPSTFRPRLYVSVGRASGLVGLRTAVGSALHVDAACVRIATSRRSGAEEWFEWATDSTVALRSGAEYYADCDGDGTVVAGSANDAKPKPPLFAGAPLLNAFWLCALWPQCAAARCVASVRALTRRKPIGSMSITTSYYIIYIIIPITITLPIGKKFNRQPLDSH